MANEFKVKNGLIVSGSADFEQDLRVRGTLTVDEFHTSITTSSIIYESGSTRFGNSSDDVHSFTGSVNITGSISLNGQAIGTGKLDETTFNTHTASYNSFTTSYISNSSSFNTRIGGLESFSSSLDASFVNEIEFGTFSSSIKNFTSSLNSYTNSLESRLSIIETSTGSLNTFSSSTNTRLNSIESTTASLNSFTSSTTTKLSAIETSTGSLNSFTNSINTTIKNKLNTDGVISGSSQILSNSNIVSSSAQVTAYGFAITGSNTFKGDQYVSGSIIPTIDNAFDLGSPTSQWRDVYISSGSLYIDNTKVLSSTAQELVITTDTGQSIKILEGTTDSIILQTADGDIELKSSADGDILLDPTNGKIMLKGPIEVLNGNKIQSSIGGTPVVFASDIVVSGSIDITGTIEGIDLTAFSSSLNTRLTNLESSGGSLNSFTASAITRLNSIETSTSSLNTYTSSTNIKLSGIETSTGSLNTFTSSTNTRLNSIETATSSLNSHTSSTNTRLGIIESTTSSINTFTSSANTRLNTIESTTSSINLFTSSASSRLNALETSTSSLNSYTSSVNSKFTSIESVTSSFTSYSGTTNSRLNSIETSTGSLNTFSSSTNTKLSSIESTTASIINTNSTQDGKINSLEGKTGSYATTGSNTFIGNQTITGSLYVSQDLIIAGSSSIQHISSSVVNIADNIITVNAQNPSIRFGGLAVIDSGSSPQVSGSILFDSTNDQWIFVHQNQSTVTSSILLMGPQTFNNLGLETYPTTNRLLKSVNAEHLGDSNITDTGIKVSINSNTEITGTFVATGTALVSGSSQINHNTTTNYDANQHVDHTTVSITAGNGLSGGGTIASTRTLTLDTGSTHFTNGVKSKMNTDGVVSGSSQITYSGLSGTPSGIVSGSSQITYSGISGIPSGIISGSVQVDLTSTTNYVSGIKTRLNTENVLSSSAQVVSALPAGTVSGSSQVLNGTTIHSGAFFNGITVVSGSGQISFGGITGVPSGLVSGSSQVSYTGLSNIPSGIVSGSSQIAYGSISGIPGGIVSGSAQVDLTATTNYSSGIKTRLNAEGVVSGSSQVSFGSISGVPSGLVSGSSQISFGSISSVPSGLVSGSSQISFGSVSGVPSGLVSGSSQITLSSTTGYGSVLNQAVLTTSTPTFAGISSTSGISVSKTIVAGESTPLHLSYVTSDGSGPAVRFGSSQGFWDIQPSSNNQRITFEWNDSVNVLSLLSNGNVGLSTLTPSRRLTLSKDTEGVTGGLELRVVGGVSDGNNDGIFFTQGSSGATPMGSIRCEYKTNGYPDLGFYTRNASATESVKMTIRNDGNIGINNTNPGSRLTVSGANSGSTPLVDLIASGTGTFQRGVRLLNSGMNAGDHIMMATGQADSARNMGQFYFQYNGAGSTSNRLSMGLHSVDDVFNILGNGNVGVGTVDPLSKFEVEVPSSTNTGGVFLDMTGGGGGAIVLGLGSSVGPYIVGNTFPDGTVRGSYGGSRMGFNSGGFSFDYSSTTTGARTWSTFMTINSSGNVGIGVSPTQRLHVNGFVRANGFSVNETGGTISAFIGYEKSWLGTGTSNSLAISAEGGNTVKFFTDGSTIERARIANDGIRVNPNSTAYASYLWMNREINNDGGILLLKNSTLDWQINNTGSSGDLVIYSYGVGQTIMQIERANGNMTYRGNIVPQSNGSNNLGSSSLRWNTVFTSDLSMSNGIGDYTIVEGEEDLFIYNNKTNKVFKFLLQEVDPTIAPPKKS